MSNLNDVPAALRATSDDNGMKTVGYRIVGAGSAAVSTFVFETPVAGIPPERHEAVVLRREAEEVMAALKDENDERGLDIDILARSVNAWKDSAAQMHRNAEFWEGLVRRVGKAVAQHDIGVHISDDGKTWNTEPLALKVVESIEKSYAPKNRFQRALRILITGK